MTAVNYRQRLDRFLTDKTPHDGGEFRGYCPVCEDPESSKTPSASFNFEKGKFFCFKSCGGMSLKNLMIIVEDDEYDDKKTSNPGSRSKVRNIGDAPTARKRAEATLPDKATVRQWSEALLQNKTRMEVMVSRRGLTKDTVSKFMLGYANDRYTIPVYDFDGEIVNVRRYNPTARMSKDKMVNITGHGQARLFLVDILAKSEVIIITEGEMDAIIGRQHGLPTMSHTAGASVWKSEWSPLFEGKEVYVCYDVDDTGNAGADKVIQSIKRYAAGAYKIRLPLSTKGSDLTNYLHDNGYTEKDFRELMREAKAKSESKKKPDRKEAKPQHMTLEKSMDATLGDVPMDLTVLVAGKVQPAYNLPKKVNLECDMDNGNKCARCPMQARGGHWSKTFQKDDEQLLEMIDASKGAAEKIVLRTLSVPQTCPRVIQEVEEAYSVEELLVMPSIDNREEQTQTPISRRIYNVGAHDTQTNQVHQIIGYNTRDPRNSRSVFQAWETQPVQTNIDKFTINKRVMRDLLIFQPKKGQTPLSKMEEIAKDLAFNVTRIYGRPEMHMAYDTVWHSVMDFHFKGQRVGKGWLELLVMGDTRTGKSEAALRLTDHYQAGVLKSCEGATLAGLVGGAQQQEKSWMVSWGTIPLNDRRLVILDEVSGIADKNIFEQMSAVRSSGKAQITKIISQETSARTRLIWISNPVDGRTIEQMSRGAIDGIAQLVKNPEDISRFDMAMSAASNDVDSQVINNANPDHVKHRYTSDRCATLVSWVWSRKAEDVVFAEGVEDYIFKRATELGERYVSEPPLIQSENVRMKLARVAAAIAGRVFSSDSHGVKLIVKREHVDSAIELMDRLYAMESFGYQRHSHRVIRDRERAIKNRQAAYDFLRRNDDALHALRSINGERFRVRDFEEFAGMMRDEAQAVVRELMGMHMLRRMARGEIRMEPALVQVLRKLEDKLED